MAQLHDLRSAYLLRRRFLAVDLNRTGIHASRSSNTGNSHGIPLSYGSTLRRAWRLVYGSVVAKSSY